MVIRAAITGGPCLAQARVCKVTTLLVSHCSSGWEDRDCYEGAFDPVTSGLNARRILS